jgi:hypothetical protein
MGTSQFGFRHSDDLILARFMPVAPTGISMKNTDNLIGWHAGSLDAVHLPCPWREKPGHPRRAGAHKLRGGRLSAPDHA